MSRLNGDAVASVASAEPESPVPLVNASAGQALDGQLSLQTELIPATAAAFSEEVMLRDRDAAPLHGWRRLLFRVTAGRIAPGPSAEELRQRELVARLKTPIRGCRKIAFVSRKGGVGFDIKRGTYVADSAAARGRSDPLTPCLEQSCARHRLRVRRPFLSGRCS